MEKKKYYLLIIVVIMIVCFIPNVYAHPGRTDSNGCHTCRTNCERWGLSYGQYHCHNGGSSSTGSSNSNGSSSVYSAPSYVYGCTDKDSINYNPNANKDNGSCIKKVNGCTDSNAYNYNEKANVDDGSCISKVMGCTNNEAINYNSSANTSDGTCLFEKNKVTYKKIKYKVKKKNSFFHRKGYVIQKGVKGKKKITEVVIVNEQKEIVEVKDKKVETIRKPVNKIVAK